VRGFVTALEEVVIATLRGFGIEGCRRAGLTGVWARAGDRWAKVASLGVRIARGVSYHGIALNVMDCSDGFRWIVPCGLAGESVTSMESLGESRPRVEEVADAVREQFGLHLGITWRKVAFGAITSAADGGALIEQLEGQALRGARKPEWLRVKLPGGARFAQVREVLGRGGLHTVCESARCPNQHECWNAGTATFLILGNHCTRDCRFCAVAGGPVAAVDPGEAEEVARAAQRLGLSHVVVTSVTRDDLPDGGAGAFVATLRRVRERLPGATVEVLIPDFAGDTEALDRVLAEQPDVLNHNIETVPRLYPVVRAGADLRRSLGILQRAAAAGLRTKSGLMVGLGEGDREILEVLRELRRTGCDRLTIGQYLQPTRAQLPVQRYATPAQFADWRRQALDLGFVRVESGPLVRSSYRAAQGLL
jgi:lipoic acid synthetase